ncbi:uncharacterized protein LOC135267925 [Tribolium castaneum]|uniref:uncharacterized protein LOC135267925 n=1 Tax=Tribolium castaneum TaxID=7070 RepID=UPI0030FE518E
MFARNPTAVKLNANKSSAAFSGVDGNVLAQLSQSMDFVADISSEFPFYGQTLRNGSVTGTLGAVAKGVVDLAMNGRFIVGQEYDCVEFTVAYSNDKICVVAPKSGRIPHWAEIFHSFRLRVWLLIFLVIIMSLLIWCAFERSWGKVWIEMCSIFINVPVKLSLNWERKIYLTFLLQFLVIINGIFQGNLIKTFSAVSYYPDINTLEQLDHSGLKILTSLGVFNNNESELFKHLQGKVVDRNQSAIERVAYCKDIVALERKNDANLFKSVYVSSDGTSLIHLVQECPISYHLGFIVTEGSPYLPRVNQLVRRMFECGLTQKWYSDMSQKIIIKMRFGQKVKENRKVKAFSLYDMQLVFLTLVLGLMCSIVVFVGERGLYCYRKYLIVYEIVQ